MKEVDEVLHRQRRINKIGTIAFVVLFAVIGVVVGTASPCTFQGVKVHRFRSCRAASRLSSRASLFGSARWQRKQFISTTPEASQSQTSSVSLPLKRKRFPSAEIATAFPKRADSMLYSFFRS